MPMPGIRAWMKVDNQSVPRVAKMGTVLLLVALLGACTIVPESTATIHHTPTAIAAGPDGNLWLTDQPSRVGRMTPSGVLTEYALPSGSRPYAIIAGPDGNLWTADGNDPEAITRITPTGTVTAFPSGMQSPLFGIAVGSDGALWYTDARDDRIGRMTADGTASTFPLLNDGVSRQPMRIVGGPDGNLWFTEQGIGELGRMTVHGKFTEFPVPTFKSHAYGLTVGSDGNLWYTEVPSGGVVRMTPTGITTDFDLPADPDTSNGPDTAGAIATGPGGDLWIFVTGKHSNAIEQLTVDGRFVARYTVDVEEIPPDGLVLGPDGNLWFADIFGYRIGRMTPQGSVTYFDMPSDHVS